MRVPDLEEMSRVRPWPAQVSEEAVQCVRDWLRSYPQHESPSWTELRLACGTACRERWVNIRVSDAGGWTILPSDSPSVALYKWVAYWLHGPSSVGDFCAPYLLGRLEEELGL